jgi:hypothetical protein
MAARATRGFGQYSGVARAVGYELTALGRELEPVVLALERWGWATLGEPTEGELLTADALAVALRAAFQADASRELPATEYVLHVGEVSMSAIVADGELDVIAIGPGALPQPGRRLAAAAPTDVLELAVEPAGFRDMLGGPGEGALLAGDDELLERFRRTFRIDPGPRTDSSEAGPEASVA